MSLTEVPMGFAVGVPLRNQQMHHACLNDSRVYCNGRYRLVQISRTGFTWVTLMSSEHKERNKIGVIVHSAENVAQMEQMSNAYSILVKGQRRKITVSIYD
jgi:hypothetical protein